MTQIKSFSELNVPEPKFKGFVGEKIAVKKVLDKEITVFFFKIVPSKYPETGNGDRLDIQIEFNSEKRLLRTSSTYLQEQIKNIPENGYPFTTKIKEQDERFMFT